ncbi:MAG: ATP-dependent helicase/nuclease subunit A [Firmicutes bacterium ADurb.Bin080]|nr:MAG: ATP-dependent helicase/nuclease subunit A [Firmicutes bacterium ADurb.Bin080]
MTSFFGKFSPSDLLSLRTHRIKEINESETLSEIEKIQEVEKIKNENIYQALSGAKGEIGQKAKRLLDMIEKYRDESYLTDVASLMMRIATETGFDAEMLSMGESRISSFNTFVEFLRDKEFNKNIEAYLSWVDKDLDIEAKLPGSGSNCVRINTIHGSKGLEYPIVFFTNSDQGFKKGKINSKDILMDKDLGVAAKYVDIRLRKLIQTPSYISISERLSEREKEEQMRILYVALTRAMNRLIVTGAKPPKNFDPNGRVEDISKLNCLIEYASSRYPSFREEYYDNYEPEEAAETTKEITLPEIKEGEKISFHSYEHLPATKIHNKYTVTELASTSMSMIEKNGAEEGILPNMVPYTPEQGTFYHKILEKIDFSSTTDEEIKNEIDRLYLEGIPGEGVKREEIDDSIIIRALNNKLFRDMKGKEILREQPFMMYLPYNEVIEGGTFSEEKVIVQGVIDLMSVEGEEVTLVDYKYSRSTPDAIKQRYFEQMRVYTLAIEKILKKTVLRKVIYLLSQDKVVEF